MKTLAISTLVYIVLMLTTIFGQAPQDLLAKSDELQETDKLQANYDLLNELGKSNPGDPEVLWRIAQAHFNFSDNTENKGLIKKHILEGFYYADKALKIDDNNWGAHKWYGIMIGRKGEIEGIKQKIKNAYEVSDHVLRSIELNPNDDGNYHVMGRWNYDLDDLSRAMRIFAAAFFAKPPIGKFEEAKYYFSKAAELNPSDVRNHLWLGKTYIKLKDRRSAKKALEACLAIEPKSDSDRLIQKEARKLLGK
jgi:tetratricopeptide (TPR) repeat protein